MKLSTTYLYNRRSKQSVRELTFKVILPKKTSLDLMVFETLIPNISKETYYCFVFFVMFCFVFFFNKENI